MVQYHVTLNGQGYLLDLDRYQKRIREPFPSKQTEGSVDFGDLRGPEQLLVISDWSGGEGATVYQGNARYRSGSDLDVSVPGALRLGPQLITQVPNFGTNESSCLASFNSHLIIGLSNGQIYRWDGTTLTLIGNASGAVRCMEVFLNKLYIGVEGSGNVAELNTSWGLTNPKFTVPGSPLGVFVLRLFYQQAISYLFVAATGTGLGGIGRVYIWDAAALSTGQQDFEEPWPFGSGVLNGRLYFASNVVGATKRIGLYSVDDSGSGGVWRQHGIVEGLLCRDMVPYAGALYLGCSPGGIVLRWDGSQLTTVLQLGTTLAPHTADIWSMAVWEGALWVATSDANGVLLLRYDGRGWSRPVTAIPATQPRKLWTYGGQLDLGTFTLGTGPFFSTGAGVRTSGTLDSGLIDCGLPGVAKLFKSVTIVTSALSTGQAVQVQYRLEDTGAWTTLGTLAGGSATTATYSFAANTTGRQIELRVNLTTSSAGNGSPILYELSVRYVPRPAVAREWELAVILDGTAELPLVTLDQAPEPLTGAQLSAALWTAAGVAGTVTLIDIDGASYQVYVQDVQEEVGKISQRRGYQRVGLVKLVEAAA